MKERGNLYLGENDAVPDGEFIVAVVDRSIKTGEKLIAEDIHYVYVAHDNCLADKWIGLGIARKEVREGKDTLLLVAPGIKVTLAPECDED